MNELAARVMANEIVRGIRGGNGFNRARAEMLFAANWRPVQRSGRRRWVSPYTGAHLNVGAAYEVEMAWRKHVLAKEK